MFRTAIEAEIFFAARVIQVRFLIVRFAQQNALLLRTTDIRGSMLTRMENTLKFLIIMMEHILSVAVL